jgi:hypothetical protein
MKARDCLLIGIFYFASQLPFLSGCSSSPTNTNNLHRRPTRRSRSRSNGLQEALLLKAALNSDSNDDDDDDDERKRMEMVRSLQKAFYSSPDDETALPRPELQTNTGILTNLPLWRVGWVEVPGRANCLNVHEGQYTHMFETIVNNGPEPWYVGHLHLPGGSKMALTGERRFDLKCWREEIKDKGQASFQQGDRSAVVGTLMRITDFRRMEDGRLCILVHVLERFVVDKVVQSFPYSVADVQILPDLEAFPQGIVDENFAKIARGAAVTRSFQYHEYEFDKIKLPLPQDSEYLSSNDGIIQESEIAKVLPFAFYSSDDSSLDGIEETVLESSSLSSSGFSGGESPLEDRLQKWRILRNPPPLRPGVEPKRTTQDLDTIETLVWLALEDFCRSTDFVLPQEILCLMPPHIDYLDMQSRTPKKPVLLLSEKYPAKRRQQRLSYALPALLESTNLGAGMRQIWLNTPSTQARLSAVLERFELINDTMMGELE